jgi:hypothetical protein
MLVLGGLTSKGQPSHSPLLPKLTAAEREFHVFVAVNFYGLCLFYLCCVDRDVNKNGYFESQNVQSDYEALFSGLAPP